MSIKGETIGKVLWYMSRYYCFIPEDALNSLNVIQGYLFESLDVVFLFFILRLVFYTLPKMVMYACAGEHL